MKWDIRKREHDPHYSVDSFHKDINRVFDDFFSLRPSSLFESSWIPNIDVDEDEKSINVHAELPGIDEKDLNVTIQNNMLVITGEKKEEKEKKNMSRIVSERRYGSFNRTISLPEGINPGKIKAQFKKGILNIEIPKEGAQKAQKIAISVK